MKPSSFRWQEEVKSCEGSNFIILQAPFVYSRGEKRACAHTTHACTHITVANAKSNTGNFSSLVFISFSRSQRKILKPKKSPGVRLNAVCRHTLCCGGGGGGGGRTRRPSGNVLFLQEIQCWFSSLI